MDYFLVLDETRQRPDPVSRWQPQGVHGPSRIVDPAAFAWSDQDWTGLPLEDYVLYELHIGTFTPEGTFEGVIGKLPYLRDLGITAIELMPVAEFPGGRNWGYDGVCLYAPQSSYGGPLGLQRLVDASHRAGLAVVLDVVYNHLGPEGNYLGEFAPYFTDSYRTPWGRAVNFDGPHSDGVRRFFLDNALYWLTEYHVDALRLDAIHGIFDGGARHILQELTELFHDRAKRLGRRAWIIAESDLNDVRVIQPRTEGGYGVDTQWHDDFHHALHTVLNASDRGYLADFNGLEDLPKALCEGFVYDGRYSRYRRRRHGSSSKTQPGHRFIAYIQNHDQIANACQGERLSGLVSVEQQKVGAALLLCAPYLPMLFMGQEFGETNPFLYFTSHSDLALAAAVREGRREEFAAFGGAVECPDTQEPLTLERSKITWPLLDEAPHAALLRFYQDWIALRKRHPCLSNCRKDLTRVQIDAPAGWLLLERGDPSGDRVLLVCNFSGSTQTVPVGAGDVRWQLVLWTAAPRPPATLEGAITLGACSAVLYSVRRAEEA